MSLTCEQYNTPTGPTLKDRLGLIFRQRPHGGSRGRCWCIPGDSMAGREAPSTLNRVHSDISAAIT